MKQVTIQQFTRDLWEAQREDLRRQLDGSVAPRDFDKTFPAWENLDDDTRAEKMKTVNQDLLKVLDIAGYQVQTKVTKTKAKAS